ncbi:MAG: hypothetical protein ACK58U_08080 [Rubrivivax sp.]|jgi:hypothetical protein
MFTIQSFSDLGALLSLVVASAAFAVSLVALRHTSVANLLHYRSEWESALDILATIARDTRPQDTEEGNSALQKMLRRSYLEELLSPDTLVHESTRSELYMVLRKARWWPIEGLSSLITQIREELSEWDRRFEQSGDYSGDEISLLDYVVSKRDEIHKLANQSAELVQQKLRQGVS